MTIGGAEIRQYFCNF